MPEEGVIQEEVIGGQGGGGGEGVAMGAGVVEQTVQLMIEEEEVDTPFPIVETFSNVGGGGGGARLCLHLSGSMPDMTGGLDDGSRNSNSTSGDIPVGGGNSNSNSTSPGLTGNGPLSVQGYNKRNVNSPSGEGPLY